MNRKFKVTSVTAAALASLVLMNTNFNNEVKADTKPINNTAKAQTPEKAARDNVTSAQKNVTVEQSNVDNANANLSQAENAAQAPNAAYKTQSDKVDALKKIADQKDKAFNDAKAKVKTAQDLVNEAKDPAKVKAAQNAVPKQATVVADANDAKTKADKAVIAKNKEVKKLDYNVQSDTQDVKDKTDAKNKADQAVKNAEDRMNDTGFKQAATKLSEANANVEQDKHNIAKNKLSIEQLSEDKTKTEEAYTRVKNDRDNAQDQRTKAQSNYENSEQISNKAAVAVSRQQAMIAKLKDQKAEIDALLADQNNNKIIIRDKKAYRKAYADYVNGNLTNQDKAYIDQAINENQYVSSNKAAQENVDVNNLTDEQIRELSIFAAYLHNQVRQELGLQPNDIVTDGSVKFAKEVADGYRKDNWSIIDKGRHDNRLINNLSIQNGLKSHDDNNGQLYEDAFAEDYSDPSKLPNTMDDLRKLVFDSINDMIFGSGSQYEFDHARGVLGAQFYSPNIVAEDNQDEIQEIKDDLDDSLYGQIDIIQNTINNMKEVNKQYPGKYSDKEFHEYQAKIEELSGKIEQEKSQLKKLETHKELPHYIGASIVYLINSNENDPYEIQVHFEDGMNPLSFSNDSTHKFDTNIVPSYDNQLKSLENKIKHESGILNKLKSAAATAKQKADQDKDHRDSSLKKFNQKQKVVIQVEKKLQQITQDLNNAKSQKIVLNNKLDKDTKDQQTASATVNIFKDKHKQLFNNYQQALNKQTTAQSQLNVAKEMLTRAKAALNKAQNIDLPALKQTAVDKDKTAKVEQNKLNQLKQHIEDLSNAATILANAQQAEKDAQNAFNIAKKNVTDAEKILNSDLKTNKDKADARVITAQQAYDEALARLQTAKDTLAKAEQKLQAILNSKQAQSESTSSSAKTKSHKRASSKTKDNTSTGYKKLNLTHNAFVYNKHGKIVKSGLHIKWIKRGKLVKLLKNAKIVKIKGKKFYQIGKSEFIKVANFKLTVHAVHIKAKIKGTKKIKAYSRSGKFNKHYAHPGHTYTFNEKAKINGKTYYKIAGTNNWILAKRLALKK